MFTIQKQQVNVVLTFNHAFPTLAETKLAAERLKCFFENDPVLKHSQWYITIELGEDGGGP